MFRTLIPFYALLVFGCASTDRVIPQNVTLPEASATVEYAEFQPKLRDLGWRINEAFYRDDWDEVANSSLTLEKATDILKRSTNVPARLKDDLPVKCTELASQCGQMRSAAKEPNPAKVLTCLQTVHNLIRELRP